MTLTENNEKNLLVIGKNDHTVHIIVFFVSWLFILHQPFTDLLFRQISFMAEPG